MNEAFERCRPALVAAEAACPLDVAQRACKLNKRKAELDPRIAKVKGTVLSGIDTTGSGNGILTYDNDYKVLNVTRERYNGILTAVVWGGLNTVYSEYEHKIHFEANLFDDDDYVVLLTPYSHPP